MNILLTGGAGYIGSHTAVALSEAGHDVVLLDSYLNSSPTVLGRLYRILGKSLPVIKGDVRDTGMVEMVLREYDIDAVIHFAGLKSVDESTVDPIAYYDANVKGAICLLQAMQKVGVKTFVFSSSATVYGEPHYLPIDESHPLSATNAYGRTKLYIEDILKDVADSDEEWKIICLRYFNPVGAHESGLIGENPNGVPNNLVPYIAKVASGQVAHLNIFGSDYDTIDGTGIRDYIHIMDLAEGHLAALEFLKNNPGWDAVNLGTGQGVSVLQIVSAYRLACGNEIPFLFRGRRAGDVPSCYAGIEKAQKLLKWIPKRNINEMCSSSWQAHLKKIQNA